MNERDRRTVVVALFQQRDQPSTVIQNSGTHKKPTQDCIHLTQVPQNWIYRKKEEGNFSYIRNKKEGNQANYEKICQTLARSHRKLARDHNL